MIIQGEQSKYNFVEFTKVRVKHYGSYIGINKPARFTFSTDFVRDHQLAVATRVVLYFDPKKLAIGFHFPMNPQAPDSLALLAFRAGTTARYVAVPRFFKLHSIDVEQNKGRYSWKTVNYRGMKLFVLRLKRKASRVIAEEDQKRISDSSTRRR